MTDAKAHTAESQTAPKDAMSAPAAKPAAKTSATRAPSAPGAKKAKAGAAKPATAETKSQSKAQPKTKSKSAAKPATKASAKTASTKKVTGAKPVAAKTSKSPKAAATATAKKDMNPMKDTIENMTAKGNEAIKEGFEKTLTAVNDANAFQKDNVDAMIASATAAGKGFEAINTNAVSYAKTAMEGSVAAAKAVSSAKSIQEMFEIQADFAKSAMDAYLAEINKTTDLFATTVKDSVKPLNERVSASVELTQSFR